MPKKITFISILLEKYVISHRFNVRVVKLNKVVIQNQRVNQIQNLKILGSLLDCSSIEQKTREQKAHEPN
jgi:hypothetical protein